MRQYNEVSRSSYTTVIYDTRVLKMSVNQKASLENNGPVSSAYSFKVKEYVSDDGIESLLLLGLSYKDVDSAAKRSGWLYSNNPAGAALVCVMHHNQSQAEVGLIAIVRRQIWTRSGIASVGMFCDLVIDKAHRTLGPALKLMEVAIAAADENQIQRVDSLPSPSSVVLFKRLPKTQEGSIGVFRRYFDWNPQFASRLPKPLALVVSNVVGLLDAISLRVKDAIRRCFFITREPEYFSSEYDELWASSRTNYDEIGVRDSQFLNWRFGEGANYAHKIFAIYSRDGEKVVGYIAYREIENNSVLISDFLCRNSGFSERSLINAFCFHAYKNGYKKISVLFCGNKKTIRNLMLTGFIRVGSEAIHSRYSSHSNLSLKLSRTHLTRADQDVG